MQLLPTAPEVLEAMTPYFTALFQNPASVSGEALGLRQVIRAARRQSASLLGALDTGSIVFTSGATESNNWVVQGTADKRKRAGHPITSSIEHPSVLEPMRRLQKRGWKLTILPVGHDGLVTCESLANALTNDTVLVSVMAANNETGVVQPIAELSKLAKGQCPHILFHTDATQMVGKLAICCVNNFADVDLLSLSAHKFHGPKGCGALFIREGIELEPMLVGGGHEGGRRSGTTNVAAVVGLGKAAFEARQQLSDMASVSRKRDTFESKLQEIFPDVVIHGIAAPRLPNTSCFSLPKM
jgi:cysteine desulfurase